MAAAGAVCLTVFHAVNLLRAVLSRLLVCDGDGADGPNLRTMLVGTNVFGLWVLGAYLACSGRSSRGKGPWPEIAMLALLVACGTAETWLLGPQQLLAENRWHREFTWRIILGACVAPCIALPFNLVYAVGQCFLYWHAVPDGMKFVPLSSPVMLAMNQGCQQLYRAVNPAMVRENLEFVVRQFPELRYLMHVRIEAYNGGTSICRFLTDEAVLLVSCVACLLILQWFVSMEITKSLEVQSSGEQLLGLSRVMDALCDATVQLSSDLCVEQRAPRLDAMLHFGPTPTAMQGSDFRSAMAAEADRECFEARVERCKQMGDQHMGEAMFLDLLDSNGTEVRVQLLLSMCKDVAGNPSYVCGINEVGERGQDPAAPLEGGRGEADGVAALASGCSHATRSSGASGELLGDVSAQNVAVRFLAESSKILQATAPFQRLVGLALRARDAPTMASFLVLPDEFTQGIQERAGKIRDGQLETPLDEALQLELRVFRNRPGLPARTKTLALLCCIHFPAPADNMPADLSTYAVIMQVMHVGRSFSRTGSSSNGGSSRSSPSSSISRGCFRDGAPMAEGVRNGGQAFGAGPRPRAPAEAAQRSMIESI